MNAYSSRTIEISLEAYNAQLAGKADAIRGMVEDVIVGYAVANKSAGFDFNSTRASVRMAFDDNVVRLMPLVKGYPSGEEAAFTNLPAELVASVLISMLS